MFMVRMLQKNNKFGQSKQLQLDDIRKVVEKMKENSIKPRVVKSKREARIMTKNDVLGHKWSVGEEYYLCMYKDKDSNNKTINYNLT